MFGSSDLIKTTEESISIITVSIINIYFAMNNPQVSIIVPVYKVENYIRACVESILQQTFSDFELILVDDGSPDASGKIIDELAKKDPRIRVFHQKNAGPGAARNLGLENSRGGSSSIS